MKLEEIEAVILDVLKEVQELSGRKWEGFSVTDNPIGNLDGFDSLCSIETSIMVETRLGLPSLDVDSLFFSNKRDRAFSVREAAQYIMELTTKPQGKK